MSRIIRNPLKTTDEYQMENMHVHTSVMQPQIASNNFVRYVLERRAILSGDSVLTLTAKAATGNTATTLNMSLKGGVSSLVKNATLRSGNTIISRTQSWNRFKSTTNSFVSPEERSNKLFQTQGVLSALRPSLQSDGRLNLKDASYTTVDDASTPAIQNLVNTPDFMIKVNELFPALKNVDLPLGLMNENLVIELELEDISSTTQSLIKAQNGYAGSLAMDYDYVGMNMLADYLSYNDETNDMLSQQVMGQGLQIPFHEVVTINSTLPAVAQPTVGNITQQTSTSELALQGRVVNDIVMVVAGSNGLDAMATPAPAVPASINIKINDLNMYSNHVKLNSHKIVELEKSQGNPLFAHVAEYSNEVIADSSLPDHPITTPNEVLSGTFNGIAHNIKNLNGNSYAEGHSLMTDPLNGMGTMIGSKPIIYERILSRTNTDHQEKKLNFFCSVQKNFMLQRGQISVSV